MMQTFVSWRLVCILSIKHKRHTYPTCANDKRLLFHSMSLFDMEWRQVNLVIRLQTFIYFTVRRLCLNVVHDITKILYYIFHIILRHC